MAQVIEHLPSKHKPQYCQKKKEKEKSWLNLTQMLEGPGLPSLAGPLLSSSLSPLGKKWTSLSHPGGISHAIASTPSVLVPRFKMQLPLSL
jgi:hypothetical protein